MLQGICLRKLTKVSPVCCCCRNVAIPALTLFLNPRTVPRELTICFSCSVLGSDTSLLPAYVFVPTTFVSLPPLLPVFWGSESTDRSLKCSASSFLLYPFRPILLYLFSKCSQSIAGSDSPRRHTPVACRAWPFCNFASFSDLTSVFIPSVLLFLSWLSASEANIGFFLSRLPDFTPGIAKRR